MSALAIAMLLTGAGEVQRQPPEPPPMMLPPPPMAVPLHTPPPPRYGAPSGQPERVRAK
ncbi:MAG TPA: hypothetical protein VEC11_14715 [Allosphingosinicella sp.]|nr:hypothetical protein [Allosphingosinicella sp.]